MKKATLVIGCMLMAMGSFSQSAIDSLVQLGIEYHDHGYYEDAIKKYQEALAIDPASALVHYELSLSYLNAKNYDNAIKHSSKAIKLSERYALQAYIVKGSALDYQGKTKASIRLFEKGIKKFGDDYLLYYNVGYNYYHTKNYEKAEKAFVNAIHTNPNHASSHLLLGSLMRDQHKSVQSLLSLYHFLLLEPDSERAKIAYQMLMQQFGGNVQIDTAKPNSINIFLNANMDPEFGAAEMMVSMLEASKSLEENAGKSAGELFIQNTASFFKMLGELKKKDSKGVCWEFYVPFFYDLALSDHLDTYCYYISQSSSEEALRWLQEHPEKIEQFDHWLQHY